MGNNMKDQLQAIRLNLKPPDALSDRSIEGYANSAPDSNEALLKIKQLESDALALRKTIQELEIVNSRLDESRALVASQLLMKAEESRENSIRISELDTLLGNANARSEELAFELLNSQTTINKLLDKATDLTNENISLSSVRDHLLITVRDKEEQLDKYSQLVPQLEELNLVLAKVSELETQKSTFEKLSKKYERLAVEKAALIEHLEVKLDRANAQKKDTKLQLKGITIERDKIAQSLSKAQSNENRLTKKLKAAECLNSFEFRVMNPFTVEWIVKNAIVSRDYEVFFDDPKVLLTGTGPWDESLLKDILKFANRKMVSRKDKQVSIIVAGRDGADVELVEDMINAREDQPIKIFTQELFITSILAHQDPFEEMSSYANSNEGYPDLFEMLSRFGSGHPLIEHLQNLQFPWPDSNSLEDGTLSGEWTQVAETPLVLMNYHVGESALKLGLTERDRQNILKSAYLEDIPWVESDDYMETWGKPRTRQRLARIAYHLAMLIRSRKNLPNHMAARNNWQKDLDWLQGFYKPLMRFTWPS